MTIYRTAAPRRVVGALFCAGLCAFISGSVAGGPSGGGGTEGGGGGPGEADTVSLVGIVRDFRPSPDHPDFDVVPSNGYGHYCGNIAVELDADDKPVCVGGGFRVAREWRDALDRQISWNLYDPVLGDKRGGIGSSDNGAITSAETFSQWYRDIPGVNLSTLYTITLTWDAEYGMYSFQANNFTPIDDQLFGNGGYSHNYHFTYEVVARFTYDASAGQMLWFKGDDDAWVFIDGRLVLDHGGIAGSREMYVDFDRLGLEDGEVYLLHLFHAERHQPQSHFRLQTNVKLRATFPPNIMAMFD